MIIQAKWCPTCKSLRPVEAFSPDPYKADGLQSRCRECDNARCRAYYVRRGRQVKAAYYRRRVAARRDQS
jgi:hypothetical protein